MAHWLKQLPWDLGIKTENRTTKPKNLGSKSKKPKPDKPNYFSVIVFGLNQKPETHGPLVVVGLLAHHAHASQISLVTAHRSSSSHETQSHQRSHLTPRQHGTQANPSQAPSHSNSHHLSPPHGGHRALPGTSRSRPATSGSSLDRNQPTPDDHRAAFVAIRQATL